MASKLLRVELQKKTWQSKMARLLLFISLLMSYFFFYGNMLHPAFVEIISIVYLSNKRVLQIREKRMLRVFSMWVKSNSSLSGQNSIFVFVISSLISKVVIYYFLTFHKCYIIFCRVEL